MAEKFPFGPADEGLLTGTAVPVYSSQDRLRMMQELDQAHAAALGPKQLRGTAVRVNDFPSGYQLSGDTEFGDYTKSFKKGVVDIVGSLLGVVELSGLIPPGSLTGGTDRAAQRIVAEMSPSARKNLERQWTDPSSEGVLRNPKAALQQLITVAPSVLASMIPAAGVAKGAQIAGKTVEAARAIGTATGVASEALQIGGATYNDVRNMMDGMTHDQLLQGSPQYVRAFNRHGDEAEARREVLLNASRGPSALNALWGALVAAGPSGLAAKVGTGHRFTGSAGKRFAGGFAVEGGEELAQEIPGAILTGQAIQENIDQGYDPYAGLGERAVASLMLGGGIGGPLGVAFGGRPPSKDVPPEVAAAAQLSLPLEERFGEGQPGPLLPPPDTAAPFPTAVPGEAPQQLQLPLGTAPETQEQLQYQPDMFPQQLLPILPQDTSQPIAMPPGPGHQYDMGYAEQPHTVTRPLHRIPPPAEHAPEPIEDIQAQIVQMLDPETRKQAVYVDPAKADQSYEDRLNGLATDIMGLLNTKEVQQTYPNLGVAIDPHGGLVLATDQQLIDTYLEAGATEQARAQLLGYQQSKDQLANPDRTVTVSKLNADGTVAESQVVDAEGPALDNAQIAYHMDLKPGQRVVVEPTGVTLQQRQEQLELPLTNVTEQYSGVPYGRQVEGRREGLKPRLPQHPTGGVTEEERLERTLSGEIGRQTPQEEQVHIQRMEREARPLNEPAPDSAKTIRLYRDFKKKFGTMLRQGAQHPTIRGQGDLLAGANEMFAGLSNQQTRQIMDALDAASATQRTGTADRTAALETVDEILGGNGDLSKVEAFVNLRTEPQEQERGERRAPTEPEPDLSEEAQERKSLELKERAGARRAFAAAERRRAKKARTQKKASRPIEAEADRLLAEARQMEDREPKQLRLPNTTVRQTKATARKRATKESAPLRNRFGQVIGRGRPTAEAESARVKAKVGRATPSETDEEKSARWEKAKIGKGGITQGRDFRHMQFRKRLLDAINNLLVNTFGLSPEEAAAFELAERHLSMSFTMGKATRKDLNEKQSGRFSMFEKEMAMLELALRSDDDTAILQFLEAKGLDAIAKVLVSSHLKIREAKAIQMVKRWRRNPSKVDFPAELRAKLKLIYDKDLEAALGATKAELDALIAEQQTEIESEGQAAIGYEVKGSTEMTLSEGNIKDLEVGHEPSAVFLEETPTEPERTNRGKSTSTERGTPTRREKTESEAEIDRIVRTIESEGPATGPEPDGSGGDAGALGQLRVPEPFRVPDQGTPESIPAAVFERDYGRLDQPQREGVSILWQAIKSTWDTGTGMILGDGTGVGKTTEMLVLAHLYIQEFTARNGRPPKILTVTPNKDIYHQWAGDARRHALFETGTTGTSDTLRSVINGLENASNYNELKNFKGQEFDLVIYDEAHKIGRNNSWHKDHKLIKAKHTIYTTATPGDKETSLTLFAALEGKTLKEMLQEIAPTVRIDDEGEAGEMIDITSVGNIREFYQALADKITALTNNYRYVVRRFKRIANVTRREIKGRGKFRVTLSNGEEVDVSKAEEMLIRYWNRKENRRNLNINNLWVTSSKLAELAKLQEMEEIIAEARRNGDQVLVLFGVQQQKKATGPAVFDTDSKTGDPVTLKVPIALREAEKTLKRAYPGEVTVVAGNARIKPRVEGFQNGKFKIMLGTYDKAGVGLNLDATVPREEGGAGRTLILMTDPWGPDVLDQAIGRVDRRTTQIPATVVRLYSDYQGDIARAEKLQYKQELADAIAGDMKEGVFSLDRNIKVRVMPGGTHVAIRINALPPKSKPFLAIKGRLEKRSVGWSPATREWELPIEAWDQPLQDGLSQILSAANGTASAPSEGTPETPAPAKKTTPKKAAEASKKADESPDLDSMTGKELEALEAMLIKQADKASAKEFEAIQSALNDVYAALDRKATDKQSVSHANAGPFSTAETTRIVKNAIEQKAPLYVVLNRLSRSRSLPPHRRKLLRKMARFVRHTKLEVTTEEGFRRLGFDNTAALYRGASDTVLLRDDAVDPESIVHEALHAVMTYVIKNDQRTRLEVKRMMRAVREQFMAGEDELIWTEGERQMFEAAMNDPDEFIAYGLTNDKVVAELLKTPDPNQPSLLRRFLNAVLEFLGMRNRAENRTVLDSLEELVQRKMTRNRMAADISLQKIAATLGTETVDMVQGLINQLQGSNLPQDVDQARSSLRGKVLGLTTLRQIEKIYAHVLDRLPTGNPVHKWLTAMHKKEVSQKKHATIGNEMYRAYADAVNSSPENKKAIEKLIGESTFYEVWVTEPLDSKKNKHLDAEGKKKYHELRKLYESNKTVRGIYDKLLNYYTDEKRENFRLRLRNIVDAIEYTGNKVVYLHENGIEEEVSSDGMYQAIAFNMLTEKPHYKAENFKAHDANGDIDTTVSNLLASAIKDNNASTLQNGPYFPLKRFGEWIVSAYRGEKTFTASLSGEEIAKVEELAEKKIAKRFDKPREKWGDSEITAFQNEVKARKHRLLRKKLTDQSAKHWGKAKSVEKNVPEFSGDTGTMETRQRWVSMHESQAKALRTLDAIRAKEGGGWKTEEGYRVSRKVQTGIRKVSSNTALINHVRARLGLGEKDAHPVLAALEAAAIDMMPETSVSKEQLNRKGIYGYNDDHGRALASHVQSASWYRATLEHGKEISRGVADVIEAERGLPKNEAGYSQAESVKTGDVLREVRNHINLEGNNDTLRPAVQAMGQVGFLWLLVSPAYIFVNLTQPLMFTLPWLKARQGGGMPAWRAFRNAYAAITPEITQRAGLAIKQMGKWDIDPELFDFLQRGEKGEAVLSKILEKRLHDAADKGHISKRNLDELKTMLERLSENNVLDFTLSLDTSAAAQGKPTGSRTMDVARILPHLSEVMNRAVTAIAAFEMAKSQGMEFERAVDFATDAVTETQFDYTLLNKPRYMSERYYSLAKPIFMFMQHPQHVYAMFVHTALTGGRYAKLKRSGAFDSSNPEHRALEQEWKQRRDTVIGVLATHMLMGGMTAAMFEPVKWALGLALMVSEAISGEPPEETEVYVRRWMDQMFGEGMGEIMADGLPAALGVHLSDSVSLSNLAAMKSPSRFGGGREGVEQMTFSALGPLPALVANAAQGVQDMKEGDTIGGLAKMMPRLLREPLKTYGMATTGLRDSNGHTIVDSSEFTPLELAWQTLGLRTRKVQRAYERKGELDNLKNYHRMRHKRLKERLYRARGDAVETQKVLRDIDKYNRTVPFNARVPRTISEAKLRSQASLSDLGAVLAKNEQWIAGYE